LKNGYLLVDLMESLGIGNLLYTRLLIFCQIQVRKENTILASWMTFCTMSTLGCYPKSLLFYIRKFESKFIIGLPFSHHSI
jgi:hypothetical protein